MPRCWGHLRGVYRCANHAAPDGKVFKDKVSSPEWQAKLKTIIPSYGTKLNGNVEATEQELEYTSRVLQLQYVKPQAADAAPKAELKPQAESKPVADIAL